jgi:uncharacterized protein (TIGR02594 family)
MVDNSQTADPSWLAIARKYLGTKEIPGAGNNPVIIRWWRAIKTTFNQDSVPWCAGFVGGVLEEAGIRSTRSASARSYAKHGVALSSPAYGCIVVFWRGKPNGPFGHVGFLVGQDKHGNLMILGGNQGDEVNIRPFARSRVVAYRWPGTAPKPERFTLPVLSSDGKVSTNEA